MAIYFSFKQSTINIITTLDLYNFYTSKIILFYYNFKNYYIPQNSDYHQYNINIVNILF